MSHLNDHDVSGVGQTTGTKYYGTGASEVVLNGKVTQEYIIAAHGVFASQGKASNLLGQQLIHITVNPNGTVTVYFDKFSVECKG
jgi:hypothetical protein